MRPQIGICEGKLEGGLCGETFIRRVMENDLDGKINRKDYMQWVARRQKRAFGNMDGVVDRKEYIQWAIQQSGSAFDGIDHNNDGIISREELDSAPAK